MPFKRMQNGARLIEENPAIKYYGKCTTIKDCPSKPWMKCINNLYATYGQGPAK